jgi:aspartyl-tRNA(Asn)/glutamyl-tRNA(Gln) amidotransferase subunit A
MCSYFAAWETILHVEASSYHEALLSRTDSGFSSVTRAHLEAGKQLTAQEALHAQKLRARFSDLLLNGLGDWDALALPTLPVVAPRHGEDRQKFGGRNVTTQDSMTWFCWLGNLAGLPCISLPTGVSKNGLPIGMMLMGRPGKDEILLDIARRFDKRP